jgi:hypothetical protein
MLRTNLSTRPFYNERAVRLGIGVAVVLIAGLTAFNGSQIITLGARNNELAARAEAAEERARQLRGQAAAIRNTLDQGDVSVVQAAAREANLLIERRAFSWTDLFNRFEETLPDDVRIAAVQPQVDEEGRMLVAVTVISRRTEDLDDFIEQLEKTGAFRGMLPRQEALQEDGTTRSIIQGYYGPQPAGSTAVAPAASESGDERTGNATPTVPPAQGAER